MRVYVLSKNGNPLMPCSSAKANRLLKKDAAKVIKRNPFVIQLNFQCEEKVQELTLGVDTGFQNIGLSVVSDVEEVLSATVKMDTKVSDRMTTRRSYRRGKRGRLRYRKPRFLNRSASTRKGRLAPSVDHCVETHKNVIGKIYKMLPISKLALETGLFDPHKMKNPEIKKYEYSKGEMFSYENTKAYVLSRDSHKCFFNKKSCNKKLEVHHIEYKSNGGSDNPSNLITLCKDCHKKVHKGKLELNVKKHKSLKPAAVMNIIRKRLLEFYPEAIETFGYRTKEKRYDLGIEKTHANDAFVIAGGKTQKRVLEFQIVQKRKNNRKLQLNRKGFAPSVRKMRYQIQPKDLIKVDGKWLIASGMHNRGTRVVPEGGRSISVKKVESIFNVGTLIWRTAIPPLPKERGLLAES